MPEDRWADCYALYELLRLDCCRFVWPKQSYIRRSLSLSRYHKGVDDEESNVNRISSVEKRRLDLRLENSPEQESISKKKKKVSPSAVSSKNGKKVREAIYSDEENGSEDEEDCGNALFLKVNAKNSCFRSVHLCLLIASLLRYISPTFLLLSVSFILHYFTILPAIHQLYF